MSTINSGMSSVPTHGPASGTFTHGGGMGGGAGGRPMMGGLGFRPVRPSPNPVKQVTPTARPADTTTVQGMAQQAHQQNAQAGLALKVARYAKPLKQKTAQDMYEEWRGSLAEARGNGQKTAGEGEMTGNKAVKGVDAGGTKAEVGKKAGGSGAVKADSGRNAGELITVSKTANGTASEVTHFHTTAKAAAAFLSKRANLTFGPSPLAAPGPVSSGLMPQQPPAGDPAATAAGAPVDPAAAQAMPPGAMPADPAAAAAGGNPAAAAGGAPMPGALPGVQPPGQLAPSPIDHSVGNSMNELMNDAQAPANGAEDMKFQKLVAASDSKNGFWKYAKPVLQPRAPEHTEVDMAGLTPEKLQAFQALMESGGFGQIIDHSRKLDRTNKGPVDPDEVGAGYMTPYNLGRIGKNLPVNDAFTHADWSSVYGKPAVKAAYGSESDGWLYDYSSAYTAQPKNRFYHPLTDMLPGGDNRQAQRLHEAKVEALKGEAAEHPEAMVSDHKYHYNLDTDKDDELPIAKALQHLVRGGPSAMYANGRPRFMYSRTKTAAPAWLKALGNFVAKPAGGQGLRQGLRQAVAPNRVGGMLMDYAVPAAVGYKGYELAHDQGLSTTSAIGAGVGTGLLASGRDIGKAYNTARTASKANGTGLPGEFLSAFRKPLMGKLTAVGLGVAPDYLLAGSKTIGNVERASADLPKISDTAVRATKDISAQATAATKQMNQASREINNASKSVNTSAEKLGPVLDSTGKSMGELGGLASRINRGVDNVSSTVGKGVDWVKNNPGKSTAIGGGAIALAALAKYIHSRMSEPGTAKKKPAFGAGTGQPRPAKPKVTLKHPGEYNIIWDDPSDNEGTSRTQPVMKAASFTVDHLDAPKPASEPQKAPEGRQEAIRRVLGRLRASGGLPKQASDANKIAQRLERLHARRNPPDERPAVKAAVAIRKPTSPGPFLTPAEHRAFGMITSKEAAQSGGALIPFAWAGIPT